jgi:mRNA interferase RelE/StbE
MAYALVYTEEALTDLEKLDKTVTHKIIKKLERLATNVEVMPHMAMKGQWSGYYRIKIDSYRAIYSLDHEAECLIVEVVGHRRDIYD